MSCLSSFQATVAERDLSRGVPKNHRRDSGATSFSHLLQALSELGKLLLMPAELRG